MRGIAWKAILSEAVVTEGEALGMSVLENCLEPTVTDQREVMTVPCLMMIKIKVLSSRQFPYNHITPGLCPGLKIASLSTALQADR